MSRYFCKKQLLGEKVLSVFLDEEWLCVIVLSHPEPEYVMKYYHCPNCGISIPDKEDTVVRHKAFCKSSYESFSAGSIFVESTLEGQSELLKVDINKVPKGIKIEKSEDGATKITYQSTYLPWTLLILIFFILGFSWFQFRLEERLGVPMGWLIFIIFLAAVYFLLNLLSNITGKWVLTLKEGKGTYFCGISKYGRTQTFEYNRDSTVSAITFRGPLYRPTASGSLIHLIYQSISLLAFKFLPFILLMLLAWSKLPREGIIVTTKGKQYVFGGSIYPDSNKKYVAARILREILK